MYELKRKIGILLGKHKDKFKKNKMIQKILAYINLKNSKKQNVLVRKYGVEALKIIYAECKKENVELWLDFGTLLGWYRQKDFISFDIDLDFGAYAKDREKFSKIKERLLKQGFIYSRTFEYDGQMVEESYIYKGLNIDIVYYEQRTGQNINKNIFSYLVVYAMDMDKNPVDITGYLEENNISKLVNAEFKGVEVLVPQNTEEYLANYYGKDFMTPIPNFDWKASGLYVPLDDSSKCKARVYNNGAEEK